MKVSVFGIGYVGAVTAACLADSDHRLIAVDLDQEKIHRINNGKSPIIEPGLSDLIETAVRQGRLRATDNVAEAVQESEISLICVGTPSKDDGSLELDQVVDVCQQIGAALKGKGEYHTVVLRSTCVPSTARDVAIPALEKASGKKAGIDFGFGNNPEFLREGSAVADYYDPPKIVIGADDEKTAQAIAALYHNLKAETAVTDIATAEGVKYADNCWHAMKVGFANELGNVMKSLGLDSHKVMDIFFMDRKLNISEAYLRPGFAFGGSCLPKDVRAIRASGNARGINTPIFDALLEANEEQVRRAEEMIAQSGKKTIALMGLAFKAGTDDLRESPLVKLADNLLKDGYSLKIYDPAVFAAQSIEGVNQRYIVEGIPHIAACLVEHPEQLTESAELFVIGNNGEGFAGILESINDNVPIIDLVRLKSRVSDRENYTGICW